MDLDWATAWAAERLMFWIPFVLSLSVHEYAHALAASQLGDNTAESQGRLTLDPFAHIDPIGTVALPLLGVPFGWAKPVPVNPAQFRGGGDGRFGMLFTAAAGPASNVLIALGCAVLLAWLRMILPGIVTLAPGQILASTILLNLTLALFNLLPLPPLDGSRIVDWLCPDALRGPWNWLQARAGLGIALILIVPPLLGFDLMRWSRLLADNLIAMTQI